MDFPQFFQRPSRFQAITTRWFRGLACLTQDPARRDEESIQPVTGECFSDNDTPLHVIQKPLLLIAASPTFAGVQVLPNLPGTRYYLHSVNIATRLIAADTTTTTSISGTTSGTATDFVNVSCTPQVAGSYNLSHILNVITDENTAVNGNCGIATPAFARVTISYAKIGGA